MANDANGEPLRLWNWRELFVDHHLIDRMDGTSLKLHEPRPAGAAIEYDRPWEGRGSAYMTVLEDDGVYRLYYRGAPGEGPQVTCYAESADGIEWTKPDLGLFEVAGTRDNNVILTPEVAGDATHNFSPMLDRRPGVPESEQYKALGGSGRGGLTAFASADAVTWRKLVEEPVITKGAFDSQNVCFWSWAEGLYLCYFRVFTNRVRTVARTTSKDFRTWSEPVEMEFGGAPMEQLYTNGTTSYFRAPHIYVALPGRFWPARKALSDEDAAALDVWAGSGAANDCSDAVLMTTRGGNRYDRTFMESFVRPGLDNENWVSRANYPAQGVVPTGDTEMSIYVGRGMGQTIGPDRAPDAEDGRLRVAARRLRRRRDADAAVLVRRQRAPPQLRHVGSGHRPRRAARRDRRAHRRLHAGRLRRDHRRRRRPCGHLERQLRRQQDGPAPDQAALRHEGRRPLLAEIPVELRQMTWNVLFDGVC